jgi:hypothetical protein
VEEVIVLLIDRSNASDDYPNVGLRLLVLGELFNVLFRFDYYGWISSWSARSLA